MRGRTRKLMDKKQLRENATLLRSKASLRQPVVDPEQADKLYFAFFGPR